MSDSLSADQAVEYLKENPSESIRVMLRQSPAHATLYSDDTIVIEPLEGSNADQLTIPEFLDEYSNQHMRVVQCQEY